uniref:Uncharacterized protein n=1 Tax=Arundo donax TaxID=35708 RepID=A0A0A9CAY2_ARUDO
MHLGLSSSFNLTLFLLHHNGTQYLALLASSYLRQCPCRRVYSCHPRLANWLHRAIVVPSHPDTAPFGGPPPPLH